jgi:hypothetical protein
VGRSNNDDCEHAGLALVQPRRGDTIYQSVHFRYQRNILGTPRASCSKAGQDIASLPSRLLPPEQSLVTNTVCRFANCGEVPAQLTPHSLARSSARFPPDSSDLHWQPGRQSANALRERVAGREQGEQQSQPTTPGYFVGSSDRVVKRVSILKPNLKSTLCARNLLQINYRSQ